MTREDIIRDIKKITEADGGKPPGARKFENETGIKESNWHGIYWARWGDALKEAGFSANSLQSKTADEAIFRALVEAVNHFGKFPTKAEYQLFRRSKPNSPSDRVLFGSQERRHGIIKDFRDWLNTKTDHTHIAALLPKIVDAASKNTNGLVEGSVYLIKSGAHYKIGRSDQIERRVKEIRIALPDKAELVHHIRTDNPAGIEAYWHNRFADRRANGEWFKLTRADIAAFRKRRFQ